MSSPPTTALVVRASEVIDAHTHAFPPDICTARGGYLSRDLWFEHLYANPKALLIGTEELEVSMAAAGIARSVVCGFPWRDPGLCRLHNDYLAEACAATNGRLAWLGIVWAGAGAAAESERCFRLGAVGLGELNADAQGFDLTAPAALAETVEVCLAWDRPLMLHASEPIGHDYPGKGTATPNRLVAFLQAFPALRVTLAHWGGGLPFYELMPEVAAATARVVYDTAASTYLYRFGVFRAVLDVIGAERVMFGSDYPVLTQGRFLRRSLGADLREDEIAPLFGGTAARVYGLPPFDGAGR